MSFINIITILADKCIGFRNQATKKQAKLSCARPHEGIWWDWRYSAGHFLTSLLRLASRHGRFNPKQTASAPVE